MKGAFMGFKDSKIIGETLVERERKRKKTEEIEKLYNAEYREQNGIIIDGYENPIEASNRYTTMERIKAEIELEREADKKKTEKIEETEERERIH